MRWSASRCWSLTDRRDGPGSRCWRRSASSPRNNSSHSGEADATAHRARPLLRGARRRCARAVGQPAAARGIRVAHRPNWRICARPFVGSRPRRPRHRGGHRRLRGVPRPLGRQHEPIAWAEELIEPARAASTIRVWPSSTSWRSQCFTTGRIDEAIRYADAGQEAIDERTIRRNPTKRHEASLGSPYAALGRSDRWVDWCRIVMGRHPRAHIHTRRDHLRSH